MEHYARKTPGHRREGSTGPGGRRPGGGRARVGRLRQAQLKRAGPLDDQAERVSGLDGAFGLDGTSPGSTSVVITNDVGNRF